MFHGLRVSYANRRNLPVQDRVMLGVLMYCTRCRCLSPVLLALQWSVKIWRRPYFWIGLIVIFLWFPLLRDEFFQSHVELGNAASYVSAFAASQLYFLCCEVGLLERHAFFYWRVRARQHC